MVRSRKPPSPGTTNSRAESRGLAGRSAILSGGSSKSKRSVRMAQCAPVLSHNVIPGHAKHQPGISKFRVRTIVRPGMTFGLALLRRIKRHVRLDDLVGILHRLAALD